jgi:peptide/nickel transport system substrate-binding protein
MAGSVGGVAVTSAGLGSLLEACSQGSSQSTTSTNKKLSMAVFQEPDTLDPVATGLVVSATVGYAVFDPLVWKFTGKGSKTYYPGLASSWDVSADSTTYTFKLRNDVKFHDGTQFNANAVKATFDHIVDPASKSRQVGTLGPYKETRVVDEFTAQVIFSQPNAAFINNMTGLQMVSPAALARYGADFGHNPVGTGPFKFKEYTVGQRVVVERNPDYKWGPSPLRSGAPDLSEITFRIPADPGARFNAVQTGEVQLAPNLNPQDVQKVQHDTKYKFYNVSSTGMLWNIIFGCDQIASGFNWEHYCNPGLDSLVDQANAISDQTKRTELYKQANRIIMDAAVIIPLYNSTGLFVGSSSLKGLEFTVNALPLFHNASM